jgi:lysophospholipase L1-like esterase
MRNFYSRVFLSALLIMGLVPGHGQTLALHEGDRVAFYGDSITAQRLFTRFVEDFMLTRYPNLHVSFANAGVPGDTVNGGYTGDRATRLNRDLFPHQPTVVAIMLGMNDGYYMPFDPKYLDIFENGYRDLARTIAAQAPSPRITLISPTPYDEVTHGTEFARYNEVVSRHAAFVKELAASSHLAFSDFNQAETNLLNAGARGNPKLASLLVPDRIHPSEASHWVMAGELARSWGLTPLVSSVRIDAVEGRVSEVQRAQVSGLDQKDGTLQWIQTDEALPLPLPLHDEMMQFVLGLSDLAVMDQEMLRVDGLSAAQYTLKIDGHAIGYFTREQLATGVNLALYATPMQSQAKGVDGIELKRMRLDETNFIMSIEDPKVEGALDATRAIEVKDAAFLAEERKQAQPKPHQFELSPE